MIYIIHPRIGLLEAIATLVSLLFAVPNLEFKPLEHLECFSCKMAVTKAEWAAAWCAVAIWSQEVAKDNEGVWLSLNSIQGYQSITHPVLRISWSINLGHTCKVSYRSLRHRDETRVFASTPESVESALQVFDIFSVTQHACTKHPHLTIAFLVW